MSTQQEEMELLDRIRPEGGTTVFPTSAQVQLSDRESLTVEERLMIDQIASSYIAIASKLAGKRYDEAAAELRGLEAIFLDENVSGLPAVQRRRASDLRIIGAFRGLIAEATATDPVEALREPSIDAALIEDLRQELREKEREIGQLEAEVERESVEIIDTEKLAAEARKSAYQDVLRTIARFEAVSSAEQLEALDRELGEEAAEPLYTSLLAALQSMTAETLTTRQAAPLSYRILGTVTLVGRNSITILPIANLSLRVGARIEVRRLAETGEASRVAVGTLTEVQGDKLVARIDSLDAEGGAAVTDKVYLVVE
jgi:hypothetical protein